MTDYTHDPRTPLAVKMATAGASRDEIAAEFGVSMQTASRLVKAGGGKIRIPGGQKIGKKPQYLSRVLALHDAGSSVGQIEEEIGDVHHSTIAVWLRDSGRSPRYTGDIRIPARVEDDPQRPEAIARYLAGETAPAVSKSMGLSERTVEWWAKQDGVWGQGGIQKRQRDAAQEAVRLFREGMPLGSIVTKSRLDYYQIRFALDEVGLLSYTYEEKPDIWCPCGQKTGHPGRKYCSQEHKLEYGTKRQADPANTVTLTCLNCMKEFKRPRSQTNAGKYCSNECSAKHNRTKQHIVLEDAMVLDSPYEALFYGLCRLWKIPCERADRQQAVPVNGDGWYCPDFYLPDLQIYVEVKGFEDDDDRARCAAWRAVPHELAVLHREELHVLRTRANDGVVKQQLKIWAREQPAS
jgi:hypothetical protein